jgi:peroxiredoxin
VRICAGLDEAAPPGTGPVLLVFFSTDCSTCYDDLFEARYLVDKGRWPVAVVGVAAGPREELARFLEKHAWTLPVVLDRRRALVKRFRVDAIPFKALLLGAETIYRDDPYLGLEDRRKELKRCLIRQFSR